MGSNGRSQGLGSAAGCGEEWGVGVMVVPRVNSHLQAELPCVGCGQGPWVDGGHLLHVSPRLRGGRWEGGWVKGLPACDLAEPSLLLHSGGCWDL